MNKNKSVARPLTEIKQYEEASTYKLNRPSEKPTAKILDADALQAAHLKRMINGWSADRRPAPSIIEVA